MRICYLGNARVIHLQRLVTYFVGKGHEVHVITMEPAEIEGAHIHDISRSNLSFFYRIPIIARFLYLLRSYYEVNRLKKLITRISPDILNAHYLTNYGILAARLDFHPLIVSIWGSDILIAPGRFGEKHVILMKNALRKADMITAHGEKVKDEIVKLCGDPQKVKDIHYGVDTQKFKPFPETPLQKQKDRKFSKELDLSDFPIVISIRNLEPIYDVETLIRAIPLVLNQVGDVKFIIAGKGSQEVSLKNLVASLGISDSIRFVGWIPHDELPEYLTSADIYVSTSLSDSSISVSTLEAMACGLPVVVTDSGDNKKWIEDGENGFIIPKRDPEALAERIIHLIKNEEVRKKYGRDNRVLAEERASYEKEMGKMEKLYKELIREYKV